MVGVKSIQHPSTSLSPDGSRDSIPEETVSELTSDTTTNPTTNQLVNQLNTSASTSASSLIEINTSVNTDQMTVEMDTLVEVKTESDILNNSVANADELHQLLNRSDINLDRSDNNRPAPLAAPSHAPRSNLGSNLVGNRVEAVAAVDDTLDDPNDCIMMGYFVPRPIHANTLWMNKRQGDPISGDIPFNDTVSTN